MTYGRLIFCLVAALGLIAALVTDAEAHKVYIYAWAEGDTVYTESYFSSKKKVQGGVIQVYDIAGQKLLDGRTNSRGEFVFNAPKRTDLRIVVEAGMGHRGEYILKAEEFSGVLGKAAEPPRNRDNPAESVSPVVADAEQIRAVVEQALDARLKPIIRQLAKMNREKGPGLTEVIGGIGYIFGLMGIVLYLKSRKKGLDYYGTKPESQDVIKK
jgi:nickel transport protein